MNIKSLLMPVYRRAPPSVRNLAGAVWGRHLYGWRYGPETDRLVAEARERETWSENDWRSFVADGIAAQLRTAFLDVPYYREVLPARQEGHGATDVPELTEWPVLRKAVLRDRPEDLRRRDVSQRTLTKMTTSGTTGTPIVIWRSRTTMRAWYALVEARWRGWYGVSRHDRWALFGGQEVVPAARTEPPFWIWNASAKQLYLSNLHLKRETAPHYLRAMREHGVEFADGYASTVAALARYALEDGLEAPQLRVVVTQAETLTDRQRELIGAAFRCPVRNTYGMTEAVTAASECEHGVMHMWPEAGYVEVFSDTADEPVPAGETGRLICTGLLNRDMPLVRYELGDRGSVSWTFEPCACGRTMPRLLALDGRTVDNLVTADGRRVFAMPSTIFAGIPTNESQIVQESVDRIVIRLVPGPGFDESHERTIASRIRKRLGDVTVEFDRYSHIPRGPNGKLKGMISLVDPDTGEVRSSAT